MSRDDRRTRRGLRDEERLREERFRLQRMERIKRIAGGEGLVKNYPKLSKKFDGGESAHGWNGSHGLMMGKETVRISRISH